VKNETAQRSSKWKLHNLEKEFAIVQEVLWIVMYIQFLLVFCKTVTSKAYSGQVRMTEDSNIRVGLACKLVVSCDNCGHKKSLQQ